MSKVGRALAQVPWFELYRIVRDLFRKDKEEKEAEPSPMKPRDLKTTEMKQWYKEEKSRRDGR